MLSTHLRLGLPSGLFPSGFPTNAYIVPLLSHSCYMSRPSHPRLDNSDYTWRRAQMTKLVAMHFPLPSSLSSLHSSSVQIFSSCTAEVFQLHPGLVSPVCSPAATRCSKRRSCRSKPFPVDMAVHTIASQEGPNKHLFAPQFVLICLEYSAQL
jgi:hypothetical protein